MSSSARLGGSICVTGAALWRWRTDFVAGAVFSASGCVFAWQGQHLVGAGRLTNHQPSKFAATVKKGCETQHGLLEGLCVCMPDTNL